MLFFIGSHLWDMVLNDKFADQRKQLSKILADYQCKDSKPDTPGLHLCYKFNKN